MVTNRDRKSFGSRQKNSRLAQMNGTVDVFDPRSGILGPTSHRASSCPIFMNDAPNPFTIDDQMFSY